MTNNNKNGKYKIKILQIKQKSIYLYLLRKEDKSL